MCVYESEILHCFTNNFQEIEREGGKHKRLCNSWWNPQVNSKLSHNLPNDLTSLMSEHMRLFKCKYRHLINHLDAKCQKFT